MSDQLSYRQELDLLENLDSAIHYTQENTTLDEIVFETCNEWVNHNYAQRRTQWIMAGCPDMSEDHEEMDLTVYLDIEDKRSLTVMHHTLIGIVLSSLASGYAHKIMGNSDTHEIAAKKISSAIAQHRDTLHLTQRDNYAMSAPYNYALMYANQERHDVYVTAT